MVASRHFVLLCVMILVNQFSLSNANINTKICLPQVPLPQAKNFPNIPNDFRATYSYNTLGNNETMFVEEIFSDDLDIGVMVIENLMGPSQRSKFYSYARINQYVFIEDYDGIYGSKCKVGDLTYTDFAFPFRKVLGNDKLVSGKDVLLMGASAATLSYVGNDTMDDIAVDVFNGCLYVPETDMTINVTYYFSLNTTDANRWRTAGGDSTTIKRIHGIQDNAKGTAPAEFTYEYIYFSGNSDLRADQLKYLEPPLGAYCEGRADKKPLPTVPMYFSMNMEARDPSQNLITFTDEWYDYTLNLTRQDRNKVQDRSAVSTPITLIHDYETGLSYEITKYSGACEITAIPADQYDNTYVPGSNHLLRMRSPKEFFDFDNPKYPYIYEGEHKERGVDTEVWISKRPYPTEDSDVMGYWEWYFTRTEWEISIGQVVETREPFRMVVTVPQFDQVTEFNIYNFDQAPPGERHFDIAPCFDQHNDSRSYAFIMNADVNKYKLDTNVAMLQYWVSFSLEVGAAIRPLRIHEIQFEFDVTKVYVQFTLLGTPNVKGDVPVALTGLSLDEAETTLLLAIKNDTFVVYYPDIAGGPQAQFRVDKNSLAKMESLRGTNQSVYYVISDDGKDFASPPPPSTLPPLHVSAPVSMGGVAGIVIAMLVVGILLVAIPIVIIEKRKNSFNNFGRTQLNMSDLAE